MKVFDCVSEARDECHDRAGCHDVYLTFDDSINSFFIPNFLDLFGPFRVPATFCVIGAYAADQPKLIRRMIADGHEVANHTMTRPDLSRCEPTEVQQEILTASRVIRMASPHASLRYMRAPYGMWTEAVLTTSASAGRREQTLMALSLMIPALHDRGFAIRSLPQPHRTNQIPYEHACRN
ncbi:polysaccharide deacetylase family protein [Paraburkholderia sp. 40]|uniref:polysaccharide deacetylase family protein n=1 Tax=unclassified Paraburkholderia TaxID=2615204 RepID=UPI003D1BB91F